MKNFILGFCAGVIATVGGYKLYEGYKKKKEECDKETSELIKDVKQTLDRHKKDREDKYDSVIQSIKEPANYEVGIIVNDENMNIFKKPNGKIINIEEEEVMVEDMIDFPETFTEEQINYITSNIRPVILSNTYKELLYKLFIKEYTIGDFINDNVIVFDASLERKMEYLGSNIPKKVSIGDILLHYADRFNYDTEMDISRFYGEVINRIFNYNTGLVDDQFLINQKCDEVMDGKINMFPIDEINDEVLSIDSSYNNWVYDILKGDDI